MSTTTHTSDTEPRAGGIVIRNTGEPDVFVVFSEKRDTGHDEWIEADEGSYVALENIR